MARTRSPERTARDRHASVGRSVSGAASIALPDPFQLYHGGTLHGAQRCLDGRRSAKCRAESVTGNEWRVVDRERVDVVEVHDGRAVGKVGAEVDAQLLDDRSRDFGDGDLQHHLIAASDNDGVDDLVGSARQPRGKIAGLLGVDRVCRRAG